MRIDFELVMFLKQKKKLQFLHFSKGNMHINYVSQEKNIIIKNIFKKLKKKNKIYLKHFLRQYVIHQGMYELHKKKIEINVILIINPLKTLITIYLFSFNTFLSFFFFFEIL